MAWLSKKYINENLFLAKQKIFWEIKVFNHLLLLNFRFFLECDEAIFFFSSCNVLSNTSCLWGRSQTVGSQSYSGHTVSFSGYEILCMRIYCDMLRFWKTKPFRVCQVYEGGFSEHFFNVAYWLYVLFYNCRSL